MVSQLPSSGQDTSPLWGGAHPLRRADSGQAPARDTQEFHGLFPSHLASVEPDRRRGDQQADFWFAVRAANCRLEIRPSECARVGQAPARAAGSADGGSWWWVFGAVARGSERGRRPRRERLCNRCDLDCGGYGRHHGPWARRGAVRKAKRGATSVVLVSGHGRVRTGHRAIGRQGSECGPRCKGKGQSESDQEQQASHFD